jgi:hypothetical protein
MASAAAGHPTTLVAMLEARSSEPAKTRNRGGCHSFGPELLVSRRSCEHSGQDRHVAGTAYNHPSADGDGD